MGEIILLSCPCVSKDGHILMYIHVPIAYSEHRYYRPVTYNIYAQSKVSVSLTGQECLLVTLYRSHW